ncbi:MAG: glycosyltransferase family 2 protein [Scytonema sp. PMC 1069.18]|nr:glycosyltransferase family 2 protein [Scytonema sp. PMC 1069.18]MEC4885590.1 glycosyltransferase family 2 protein [Scytonema sp. PMC 1070.18]
MPKVSVIIPAYNAMMYLPATLESVLQQTFTDFEVLIVNDGSSDNIVEWVGAIKDQRVKLLTQPNQGVSVARNTGISNSEGEYIAFLDADDLWESTKLDKQVRSLEAHPSVGLVYTWTAFIDECGKLTGVSIVSHAEGNVWEQIVVRDMVSTGSSPMIRRVCFDTVGVFDSNIKIGEDRDMWSRIAAHYPFAVIKEPLTLYRRHDNNTTKSSRKIVQELHKVIEKAFASAPLELLYLRNQSYGWMNYFAAWGALLGENNYTEAMHFRRQAVLHYPQIRYTLMYVRLSLAIALIRWFGLQGYERARGFSRTVRQMMLGTT